LRDSLDTPYHHPLVEIRVAGTPGSTTINPLDLPRSVAIESVSWRPMPWRVAPLRDPNVLGPDTIFEGEDGHLFHTINGVCQQLFEGKGLSRGDCARWVDVLRHRLDWCSARNIIFRQLVIPEHHGIYTDKISGAPQLAATRPFVSVAKALDKHERQALVYPLEAMRRGRSRFETSYPHDVHFTRYGAYLCYRELMCSLPGYGPENLIREEDLVGRELLIAGDVARAFGWPGRKIQELMPPPVKSYRVIKGTSFKTTQVDVFETDAVDLPRLVISRTSNSTHLFPFLLHHFSRITAVAGTRLFYELIESEKPQVVISEIPERYLKTVPNEYSPVGFTEATGYELPLPTKHSSR
jgi:hypothetical protein